MHLKDMKTAIFLFLLFSLSNTVIFKLHFFVYSFFVHIFPYRPTYAMSKNNYGPLKFYKTYAAAYGVGDLYRVKNVQRSVLLLAV